MFNDNFMNSIGDPILPDFMPEIHMFGDPLHVDDLTIPIIHPEVAELSHKLEHLTIESNTQGLRLEIEKTKRQRLQSSVRQIKRDLVAPRSDLVELRNEWTQFKDCQNAINFQLDGENAKTNTLAFRSLSRINQILSLLIPGIPLSPESSPEVKILLHELSLTVQQFGVHYAASYI